MNSKIQNDIKELVSKQVITPEIALNIETYYTEKHIGSPNRLFTLFAIFGSALIGMGIILILAHNWDDLPRAIKTLFAFLPLVIGQCLVGYTILKKKGTAWKEASGTFLFFAVGSSIALVSQIYNIPGDLSSYLLAWVLLCAPLVYIVKSNVLGLLHIVFATYYAIVYGYSFLSASNTPWLYLILIFMILPYYALLLKHKRNANITSIFNWILPLSLVVVLGTFFTQNDEIGFLMYFTLFGLLYNIGKLPFFNNQKLRRNGYVILGSLGTILILLTLSFEEIAGDVFGKNIFINSQDMSISIILFMLTMAILIYSHLKKWTVNYNLFRYVFVIFTAMFFISYRYYIMPALLVNMLVLALGVMVVKTGVDKFHFGISNYGMLIIVSLIFCRFFDTDISFILRGLLFVAVGIGFFLTNYIMLKKQNNLKK